MASPLGHSLAGLALYLTLRKDGTTGFSVPEAVAVVVVSNLPDLDLIPGFLSGNSSLWHHRATHSLFFALLVSVCILGASVLLKGAKKTSGRLVLTFGILICLHIGLDLVTFDDNPPRGLQVFWPFSREYFQSPVPLLDRVMRRDVDWELIVQWAKVALKEVIIFGPLLAGVVWWRRDDRKQR